MDGDERDICSFLRSWPGQFVSGKEVARRAGGKWRFRKDAEWASPVLNRLLERGVVEKDASGHFRLIEKEKKDKPKKWVAPHIQKILDQSGKDFGGTITIKDDADNL